MSFSEKFRLGFLAAALMLTVALPVAHADDDDEEEHAATMVKAKAANPKWASECGACHLAFPARFLPAESWREMMAGLEDHFGSNATMDTETAKEITDYLVKNARTRKTYRDASGKYPLRITETRWFKREHAEAARRVKNNPKVKSLANCQACHIQADMGDYSERNIKIPK